MSRPMPGWGAVREREAGANQKARPAKPLPREKRVASKKNPKAASSRGWLWPAIGFLVFAEVLLLGGHAVRWATTSARFVLGEVKITGHVTLVPESLVKLSGLRPGTNLFDVDLEQVRRRIETNPWVRRSSIRLSPPSTLRIEIEERRPVALVDRKNAVAVDREGVILGPLPGTTDRCFPLLEGFYKEGGRSGDRITREGFAFAYMAVSLFSGAPLERGECLSVRPAKDGNLWIRALGGKVDLLVNEENIEAQAAQFHAVAKWILDDWSPPAAPMQMDLTFPGRIIVRPTKFDGGSKG